MRTIKGPITEEAKGIRRGARFFSALFFMAILLTAGFSASAPLFSENTAGFPSSLQGTEKRTKIYDTNIRRSLERQKDFGDPDKANRYLDRLFDRIKTEIKLSFEYTKEEALEALRIIGRVLGNEENFEYSKNRLLIVELNKDSQIKKYLDCDDYSSIYLAAAEQIGMPLKPVYFPDHVFLKCELENDSSFFWEPTMAVESHTAFYSQWTGVSFEGGFPIILDQTQLEAIQLSDLGVAWFYREDYQKASEFFQKSVEANSEFGTAYNNLGASLAKQGKLGDALGCYQTAIDKNPLNATAFLNTGVAFYRLGDFQKSVKFFDKTLKINPGSGKASLYKYRVLVADGKPRKAVRFLNQLRR